MNLCEIWIGYESHRPGPVFYTGDRENGVRSPVSRIYVHTYVRAMYASEGFRSTLCQEN